MFKKVVLVALVALFLPLTICVVAAADVSGASQSNPIEWLLGGAGGGLLLGLGAAMKKISGLKKTIVDTKEAFNEVIEAAAIIKERVTDVVVLKEVSDAFNSIADVCDDLNAHEAANKLRNRIKV